MSGLDLTPHAQPGVSEHRHPLLPTPAEYQQLSSGLGISTIQANITALQTATGAPATPSTIAPDDAANVGTTANGRAYGNHVHAIAAAPPATLTETATSTEGVSTSFARADHVHGTDILGWDWVAGQVLETNTAALATGAATDWGFDIPALVTRRYLFCISGQASSSGLTTPPSVWRQLFTLDGVATFEATPLVFGGNNSAWWGQAILWLPATDTFTVASTVVRDIGNGSLTLQGSATKKRAVFVLDIGPR